MSVHLTFNYGSMDMPDDGASNDHSVTFLMKGNDAVPGVDLKTGGGRGGEILALGLARVFCWWCPKGMWCPGTGVKETWEHRVLGAHGLFRETHRGEVVGMLTLCCKKCRSPLSQQGLLHQ